MTPSPPRDSRRSRRVNPCRTDSFGMAPGPETSAADASAGGIPYELLPYEMLESLARGDGGSASVFDAEGIAKGSERVERFIFFPTGIPSIGSMRQRGHHAITLSGRTHFDEPGLFEHYFVFR